ncbi:MAG: ATP-binding protein [Patescibacteria group bacterium]|jgi:signal transduction histidine kinase|nr:ATP-binding protein [Patescibacteria group bacterium]
MDDFKKLARIYKNITFIFLILNLLIIFGSLYIESHFFNLSFYFSLALSGLMSVLFLTIIYIVLPKLFLKPLEILWYTILKLNPDSNSYFPKVDQDKLKVGKELVGNLIGQIYKIAIVANQDLMKVEQQKTDLSSEFLATRIPLPIFVLDNQETVKFVNKYGATYLGLEITDILGKNIYSILDLAFSSDDTLDNWLKEVKNKTAISIKSWERVKLNLQNNHPTLYFDMVAYYNLGNSQGYSLILTLFDHTKQYSEDDQAISFVAIAIHELRTPLTLLKGYIEVFSEELKDNLTPELSSFMEKMKATNDQLNLFVNNILNVARIDSDQMELKLTHQSWNSILSEAIDNISLRAKVRGINFETDIEQNLPEVGVDRISIQEVIYNLLDNAIKYSKDSKRIIIKSFLNKEGYVETTIQDFGRGIPENIMGKLFTKFYRDYHNRSQVGGTGLGLYISKAIIDAHQGNIWVKSKQNEGSTFGFTVLPFNLLSKDQKDLVNDEIVQNAHGWINNHSYYRR